jgi:large subunit ribosomal protein L4
VKVEVIDASMKSVGKIEISDKVFNCDYFLDDPVKRFKPVHEVLRWQLNKKRESIQHVKNRSEVSGAHRKLWRQKESGRARQGDGKACHFRGGGACFSVRERDYEFKLNKKFKSLAMKVVLSHKCQNHGMRILDSLANLSKTKMAADLIRQVAQEQRVLLVTDSSVIGARNLPYVDVIPAKGLNIRSMCDRFLIFDKEAISVIEGRLSHE